MVTKEALTEYLLHQMPEADRLDFAERWFCDPELAEQLEATEAELLDAYVRGELPDSRRKRVERYLLQSDAQMHKLTFAAALRGALPLHRRKDVAWLPICAAAMVVILAGVSLYVVRQNRELRVEVAALERDAHPLAGGIYSASLASSLRGSPEAAVTLPKSALVLRLDLEISGGREETYSATISTSGRRLWRQEPLRAENGGSVVAVWIPAGILDSGHYTVALESGGNPIAYYNLNILR
jgi:hypothetical protein